MKVFVTGTPLESMVWQRAIGKIRFIWRQPENTNATYHDKLAFLRDLVDTAERLRADMFKNPPPDYEPKKIDWDAVARLPKPDMSSDELMALTRGDD